MADVAVAEWPHSTHFHFFEKLSFSNFINDIYDFMNFFSIMELSTILDENIEKMPLSSVEQAKVHTFLCEAENPYLNSFYRPGQAI